MTPDDSTWRAFIAVFLGLLCGPIILPFVLGGLILKKYFQDGLSRLIGLFVVKPVVSYPLWFFIFNSPFIGDTLRLLLLAFIEVVLTVGVIILLKSIFHAKSWRLWLIILIDVSRWFVTFIGFFSLANSSFGTTQWWLALMNFAYPSFLAILAWVILLARDRASQNSFNISPG
jgi:hypothetical protein